MATEVHITGSQPVSVEEARAELELVLQSALFRRSDKLDRFLRFVFDLTMSGGAAQINEHLIGIEVFKRGPSYNPGEDSVVRRHAHVMRQKLQEYYATEGAEHAIRIEMPVGRYVPLVRRIEPLSSTVHDLPPPLAHSETGLRQGRIAGAALAVLAVGWALGWTSAKLSSRNEAKPSLAVREIWGAWIGNPAVLCFSNPTAAFVRLWVNAVPSGNLSHSVVSHPDQEAMFRGKFSFPNVGRLYFQPTIAQSMMGESVASTQFAAFFARTGGALHPMEGRFLSWENLRGQNHIILAGDAENHWADSILENYPFRMVTPLDGAARRIVNAKPQAGEPAAYLVIGEEETREEYVLLSMIPGLDADHQLLILCGLNSPALPLASEYLTTEHGLAQLTKRLRETVPRHSGTWHFQAVIRVQVRDKVPTVSPIVALRVL